MKECDGSVPYKVSGFSCVDSVRKCLPEKKLNSIKSPQPDMTRKMSGPDSVLALSFVLFCFPSKNFLKTVLNIIQGYAPK